jgi:PAS domain S-box-containing protein
MRKGRVRYGLVALLYFLACSVPAAFAEQLPVRSYTSADGLGSSFVNALMRDSRGFLWVCTRDGLSRFDGYRFVTYQVGDKNTPPGIEQIIETRKGIYWIVTTGGLYRFDPQAPVPTSKNSDAILTLNAQFVSNERGLLFEDHLGQLWAGGSSLYRVNDSDQKVSFQPVDLHSPNPSRPLGIASMAEGKDGSLWLVTFSGVLRRLPDGKEIFYSVPDPRANALTSVLEDRDGRVWIGRVLNTYALKPEPLSDLSSLGSVTVRDLNQLANKQAPSPKGVLMPEKPGEIFEYNTNAVVPSGRSKFLYQTADTHLWISSGTSLIEFDGRFFKAYEGLTGLVQGPGQMVEDSSGNLWLGGANALLRLDRGGLTSYANGLKDSYVVTINRTRAGTLYVAGGSVTLSLFDGKDFQTIRPRVAPDARVLWTANAAFQDSRGEWWILTDTGLYRFAATDDLQQLARQEPRAIYTRSDGFKSDAMFRIFEDSHGDLWISTRGASAGEFDLVRWSRTTEKFQMFSAADGLPSKSVSAFAEDKDGDLWFGFFEGGVARFANGRFTEFQAGAGIDNVLITSLLIDRQGRLWIASTASGLRRVDDPRGPVPHFASVNVDNGLASNNVRSLGEDLYGNVYAGTARGLDRISPDGTHIRHYSINDGLAGDFVTAVFRDARGTMWFGTPNGLSRLEPVPEKPAAVPPIWISGLRVAGQSHPVAEFGSLDIASFDIAHNQNNLQIEFYGVDFSAGESLHYQYQLEGADREWSAPTLQRVVSYANLAPGTYRFLVRAINADGVASTAPAAVSFRILPPFWRRWWFIVLAILTVGAAAFALDRYRVARMKELDAVNRKLTLEYDVTRLLAESSSTLEAAPKILQAICETLRWEVGAIWDVDRQENLLRCVTVWHQPEIKAPQFEEQTRARTFAPGEGLPGRVWATAAPLWIPDLAADQNFPRTVGVSHEGLRSGFGFPILVGTAVIGVIEFFKHETAHPDEALLEMMTPIGAEIGQLLVRKQNEQALRESEARFRTLAESASDAIITIDEQSTIIYINHAAENIFGYRVAEMMRADLTMLMPEYLRHVHRAGLSRYVETGRKHIGWSAVELPGLHKDGHEVPLELSFGEFTKNERRYFTGIARDITERKRAEEALRDAREERLRELERVRKRIATDLHDDIGSALTQISILSEVVHRRIGSDDSPVAEPLALIADSSRELVDSMSDIVWAINPQKDSLNDLLGRMRRFAADMLTARSIDFHFHAPHDEKDIQLGANIRREVFLIFKESINNLVKHSSCSRVEVRFQIGEDKLQLIVRDDGKGFDTSAESDGHGLASVKERAAGLAADIKIVSEPGRGTTITLNVPLGANSLVSRL